MCYTESANRITDLPAQHTILVFYRRHDGSFRDLHSHVTNSVVTYYAERRLENVWSWTSRVFMENESV
ncbi:hypothetical protein NDU88_002107 [Pleurodeles waltl]|uniref:Uncharacterized protein n=1 Tax=Pleurodeles waltl TaxID=8319 RepID=A0AAV7L2U7_PLEWA|nr:hypothetical protein NDU88_002107 [Pleurodeles waltl]